MKPITTLERSTSPLHVAPVLARKGFNCTLLTLEPGAEAELPASSSAEDQLLFVVEGEIAIRRNEVTTLVDHGCAAVLPSGGKAVVSTPGEAPARVLRVEIPPRQVITPQIITPRG